MHGIWKFEEVLMFLLDKPLVFTVLLFVVMTLVVEFAFRLAQRKNANAAQADHEQIVAAGDALRLLLCLLLGFTLAMALPRYDLQRQAVVDEANSTGTTYLPRSVLDRTRPHPLHPGNQGIYGLAHPLFGSGAAWFGI